MHDATPAHAEIILLYIKYRLVPFMVVTDHGGVFSCYWNQSVKMNGVTSVGSRCEKPLEMSHFEACFKLAMARVGLVRGIDFD